MTFAGWLIERYGERVEISADDERGLPDVGAFIGPADPATLVYCCGPEGLLIEAEAAMRDWPAGSMRAERFTAKPLTLPPTERSFQVELASSGRILDVLPDESILEVVRRAGVRVPSSCREGTCGTCETDVLAGVPDHRDSVLDDEERELGETMFICVSRSLTPRLTLDL